MTMEQNIPMDPATLATSVRNLALEAGRVLHDPAPRHFDLRALAHRIVLLRRHACARPSSDLARWLESLLKLVETHREAEFLARQACVHAVEAGAR